MLEVLDGRLQAAAVNHPQQMHCPGLGCTAARAGISRYELVKEAT